MAAPSEIKREALQQEDVGPAESDADSCELREIDRELQLGELF